MSQPPRAPSRFALFDYGFRLFFFLAGLYAALDIALWGLVYGGFDLLPLTTDPIVWHSHEMLFGFTTAVIAGFLLTAVPNWTGVPALKGAPLALLGLLWLAGRPAFLLEGWPSWVASAADLAFLPVLLAAILPSLAKARATRQTLVVAALVALALGNALMHAEHRGVALAASGAGATFSLLLIILLISIMGGRVTPSFTANALMREGRAVKVRSWPPVEQAALAVTFALPFLSLWPGEGPVFGVAALVAGLLQGARLAGWQGLATLRSPILWVLHLGFAWLALGLVLVGLVQLFGLPTRDVAIHALTAGGIGSLTLGMMSRVALGHTGRPLIVAPIVVAAYGLMTLAALARTAIPALLPDWKPLAISLSATAWSLAFLFYLLKYWPILARPRADAA